MKNFFAGALTCSLALTLVACGGSSGGGKSKGSSSAIVSSAPVSSTSTVASSDVTSSSVSSVAQSSVSSSSSSSVMVQTGVFVDSAVAGVTYLTSPGGRSGVTSITGQYDYVAGDTVVFSIGEIQFPAAPAKGVVTPLDMVESGGTGNQVVKNIAVLLQSLDADGDPSNGISIPASAAAAATSNVEFNQPYSAFASAVLPVVQQVDPVRSVVAEEVAVAHLEESLSQVNASTLVGAWYTQGENYKYVLFILDGENYAAIDNDTSETFGTMLEIGKYSWNQSTGIVTVTNVYKTVNDLDAFPPMADGNTLTLDGDTLTLTDGDETFELTRLMPTQESPLQGGWVMDGEDEKVVFAFTGTHYLMGQKSPEDEVGQPGAEVGTYVYNPETKEIVVQTLEDTNGQWGLSHPCAILDVEGANNLNCGPEGRKILQTLTVTGDTLTFISEADTIANGGEEEENVLERVNDLPDGDIHLKLQLTLEQTDYVQGELFVRDGGAATMQCNLSEDEIETTNERWVLGVGDSRTSWLSTMPATYNPETNEISFDVSEAVRAVPGHPGFYEKFHETFTGTYQPGQTEVIVGTYVEEYDLTWDRDDSVSSCRATYSVTGVLR